VPQFDSWWNRNPDQPATTSVPPRIDIDISDRGRFYATATLDTLAREVAATPEGSRNHTLNTHALRAYRLADAARLDRQVVTDAMAAAGRQCGLDDREIGPTLGSARAGADHHGPAEIPDGDDYGDTTFHADPNAGASSNGDRPPPRYTDFAALLAGGLPDPPAPTILRRADGKAIIYPGKRNEFYGDPEDGKTMIALAAAAEHLAAGGAVLFLDLDNNGAIETAQRLLMLGAPRDAITDPQRFRHIEPDNAAEVCNVVTDCAAWADLVIIDCVGELLPLFAGSSDSADDYTAIMQRASAPLERGGAAVLLIDHQAKGRESRNYGAGGTMAKRRAISGVSINVVRRQTFAPGQGGAAELWINKDRPGGLRQHCPRADGRRQFAGTFILDPPNSDTAAAWRITADRAEPAAAIDPVVERHYAAAAKLAAGTVTGATVAAVAAPANGLPDGTPPTRAQKETARRTLEKLTSDGRLVPVPGASPQRWEVTDNYDR
jgi:AAA domain